MQPRLTRLPPGQVGDSIPVHADSLFCLEKKKPKLRSYLPCRPRDPPTSASYVCVRPPVPQLHTNPAHAATLTVTPLPLRLSSRSSRPHAAVCF